MIEPAALLAWSALALAVTLTPGPDTLLVAGHAARSGFRAGMAALAGIMASVVVWYGSLIALGALSVLVAVPTLFMTVKIAGALYLTWIGAGLIWGAIKGAPPQEKHAHLGRPLAQGFLTNALNPKVALFYLAALPQFTGAGASAPLIGVLLLSIHAAFGLAWLSFVAYGAASARRLSWNRNFVRWLEGALGAFFIGVAGRLAAAQR